VGIASHSERMFPVPKARLEEFRRDIIAVSWVRHGWSHRDRRPHVGRAVVRSWATFDVAKRSSFVDSDPKQPVLS
jgi:hypothetical protein